MVLAIIMTGCDGIKREKHEARVIPVRVTVAQRSGTADMTSYVGTVAPKKSAVVSCRYPGKLLTLAVSQGDVVHKGDVIGVIESQSVRSSQQMAQATLRQAEDGYRRVAQVHESNSVADVKLIEVRTQLDKARAAAEAADRAMDDCTIKAPFDGVIGEVYGEEGVELSVSEPIAKLLDISETEIHISVPEKEIGGIAAGDRATVVIPALGDMECRATVKSKGISASPLSHSYNCTLTPDRAQRDIMPGMVCKVYMESREDTSRIVIPADVVRIDNEGQYVWTVRDGTVYKSHIKANGFSACGIVVGEGLAEGDMIITDGSQKVSTGMKVKVVE